MSNNKGNILVIILSVLALIGFATAGYLFLKSDFFKPREPVPVIKQDETTNPDSTTGANWKTYTNVSMGFQIQFPQDITVNENLDKEFLSLILIGSSQRPETELGDGIKIDISLMDRGDKNLLQVTNEDRQRLIEAMGTEISLPAQTTIGNINGYKIIIGSNSPYAGAIRIYLPAKQVGKYWQIDQYAPDPKNHGYNKTADQILSTFKFL